MLIPPDQKFVRKTQSGFDMPSNKQAYEAFKNLKHLHISIFTHLHVYLYFLRRQIKSYCIMLKVPLVRPITKRLIGRKPATANRNYGAALQSIIIALHIYYLKITLYFNRTIIVYCKFC